MASRTAAKSVPTLAWTTRPVLSVIIWAIWSPLAMISWVSPEGTKDMTMGLSSVPSLGAPQPARVRAMMLNRTSVVRNTLFLISAFLSLVAIDIALRNPE